MSDMLWVNWFETLAVLGLLCYSMCFFLMAIFPGEDEDAGEEDSEREAAEEVGPEAGEATRGDGG